MKKCNRWIAILLLIVTVFSIPITSFAADEEDDDGYAYDLLQVTLLSGDSLESATEISGDNSSYTVKASSNRVSTVASIFASMMSYGADYATVHYAAGTYNFAWGSPRNKRDNIIMCNQSEFSSGGSFSSAGSLIAGIIGALGSPSLGTLTGMTTLDDFASAWSGLWNGNDKDVSFRNDPDYEDFPSVTAVKIRIKVFQMIEGLIDWTAQKLGVTFDSIAVAFNKLTPDKGLDYFQYLIGDDLNSQLIAGMQIIGWTLLIFMVLILCLLGMLGIFTGFEENPLQVLARTIIAGLMIIYFDLIFRYFLKICSLFYNVFGSTVSLSGGIMQNVLENSSLNTVISIILGVMIMFNIGKLYLEIIERYLVVCVMYYCSPVAYATMCSRSTSSIFSNYMKMLFSQLFIFVMNNFFVQIIMQTISKAGSINSENGRNTTLNLLFYFMILGMIKVAQKIDNYMSDMGMSVSRTGGNLAGAAMGVVAGISSVARVGRTAAHAVGNTGRTVAAGFGYANDIRSGRRTLPFSQERRMEQQKGRAGQMMDAQGGLIGTGSFAKAKTAGALMDGNQTKDALKSLSVDGKPVLSAEQINKLDPTKSSYDGRYGQGNLIFTDGSTMSISNKAKPGFTQLSDGMNGEPILFGKILSDTPVGGNGSDLVENGESLGLNDLYQGTGNLSQDHFNKLGNLEVLGSYDTINARPEYDGSIVLDGGGRQAVIDFNDKGKTFEEITNTIGTTYTECGNPMTSYLAPSSDWNQNQKNVDALNNYLGSQMVPSSINGDFIKDGYVTGIVGTQMYAFCSPTNFKNDGNVETIPLADGSTVFAQPIKDSATRPKGERLHFSAFNDNTTSE